MKIRLFLNSFIFGIFFALSSQVYAIESNGKVAIILDGSSRFEQFALSSLSNLNGPLHHIQPEALLFVTNKLKIGVYTHVYANIIVPSKPGCSCAIEADARPTKNCVDWQDAKVTNTGGNLCSGGVWDGSISVNFRADISKCN